VCFPLPLPSEFPLLSWVFFLRPVPGGRRGSGEKGRSGKTPSKIASWKPRIGVLALAAVLLNACAAASSSCPPAIEYSPAEQKQVAQEVAQMPLDWITPEWLADYTLLRDQVRACQ